MSALALMIKRQSKLYLRLRVAPDHWGCRAFTARGHRARPDSYGTGLPSVKRSSCCEFLACPAILAASSSRQAKRPITTPTQHPNGIKSCAEKWLKRDPIGAVAACTQVPCEQLGYLWTSTTQRAAGCDARAALVKGRTIIRPAPRHA